MTFKLLVATLFFLVQLQLLCNDNNFHGLFDIIFFTPFTSLQQNVPFSIGRDSGMLTVSGPLDYDEPPIVYRFPIYATVRMLHTLTQTCKREREMEAALLSMPFLPFSAAVGQWRT